MAASKRILVTGGLGFIGSHIAVLLLQHGYQVVIIDNLSNSHLYTLDAIAPLSPQPPHFIQGDIRDPNALSHLFQQHAIDAVIHCAGLKAVGESVAHPLRYYDNNVNGTLCLLRAMENAKVHTLVFSSSATVYGDPQQLPIPESHPLSSTNPYGQTKLTCEHLLHDWQHSQPTARVLCLRYFNPVSAHPSGLLGENFSGSPNNLLPYVLQVALGQRPALQVFGHDYSTVDGTGVRDYLHIMDLAHGHVLGLEYLLQRPHCYECINLGTGQGYSVLQVVQAMERAAQRPIPYTLQARRPGDVAATWADPTRAHQLLQWQANHTLDQMCIDAWRWAQHAVTL